MLLNIGINVMANVIVDGINSILNLCFSSIPAVIYIVKSQKLTASTQLNEKVI